MEIAGRRRSRPTLAKLPAVAAALVLSTHDETRQYAYPVAAEGDRDWGPLLADVRESVNAPVCQIRDVLSTSTLFSGNRLYLDHIYIAVVAVALTKLCFTLPPLWSPVYRDAAIRPQRISDTSHDTTSHASEWPRCRPSLYTDRVAIIRGVPARTCAPSILTGIGLRVSFFWGVFSL